MFQIDGYEEASKKRKDADMFSDIENLEKNKQTRKERHKKIFSSDTVFDSDDSFGPPVKIEKQYARNSTSQSQQNSTTSICHANNSSIPRKIIRDLQCATSHNSNSATIGNDKVINSSNSEDSSDFNSEYEFDKNGNVENVENIVASTYIQENDHINAVVSKNQRSTSKVNMLSHEECEGNQLIYLYPSVNPQGIPIKMTSESK